MSLGESPVDGQAGAHALMGKIRRVAWGDIAKRQDQGKTKSVVIGLLGTSRVLFGRALHLKESKAAVDFA